MLTAFTTHTAQLHESLLTLRPQESETLCYHPVRLMPTQVFAPLWLSELVIHAWDIRSALDPAASLEAVSFPILVERLPRRVAVIFRPGGGWWSRCATALP